MKNQKKGVFHILYKDYTKCEAKQTIATNISKPI